MGLSILAALAIVIGNGTAAHARCTTSMCPPNEQATTTQQATEVTLERRIENALKDLEIFSARAFQPDNLQTTGSALERMIESALKDLDDVTLRALEADQEPLNEVTRKSGIGR
jgi:hypothetical protein